MTRVFEHGTSPYLVVSTYAYFPLGRTDVLLGEQAMWMAFAKQAAAPRISVDGSTPPYVASAILDEGLPKATGEVLVRGYAFRPTNAGKAGKPAPAGCTVRLVMGAPEAPMVDKSLVVSGDRRWEFLGMTMPEPFEKMPLDWTQAFGGPGFADNPVGKGFAATTAEGGKVVHHLPNVEYPDARVTGKGDRPRPGAFSPLDPGWAARMSKMGTFDKRWLETEYPGLPSDLDLTAFQTAPVDQRFAGYLAGGERFFLENMHPDKPVLEGWLPRFKARSFVVPREGEQRLREVPMHLETIQFLPHLERGILVFRGLTKIEEDDAHDIGHLLIAAESPTDPRDLAHYENIFQLRTDPETGAHHALDDRQLLPDLPKWTGDGDRDPDDLEQLMRRDQLIERNVDKKTARDHKRLLDGMREAGLDPAAFNIPLQPPPPVASAPIALEDIAKVAEQIDRDADEEEKKAAQQQKQAEARARVAAAEHGIDYDELMARGAGGGPPKFSAADEIRSIRAAVATANDVGVDLPGIASKAHDPEFEAGLHRQEAQLKDLYRDSAHVMPAALLLAHDEAVRLGRRALALHASASPARDEDLTGADLEGAQLAGADLSFAFLERARLRGADLSGANLERTVLARADLRGAKLVGANLRGANLGEADLTDADLSDADLSEAIVFRSKLHGTKLDRANLTELDAWELELRDVSLAGATLAKTTFTRVTFERVAAGGATFDDVTFVESEVADFDLTGAIVDGLCFVATKGPDARFVDASLKNLSLLGECVFPRADFTRAKARGGAFRGTDFEGARFDGADLEGADFSECNARGATFRRALLTESVFMRTDLAQADLRESKLLDANLEKAKLGGADFEGANLFQADLAAARGDDRTSFSGANLGRVRQTRRSS